MLNQSVLGMFLTKLHKVLLHFVMAFLQTNNVACTSTDEAIFCYSTQKLIESLAS